MLKDEIERLIEGELSNIIRIRRDIHQHPELGRNEFRTSELVYNELQGLGLEIQKGVGGTGVVALLKGKNPGKTFLLRADMDALPIDEDTGLDFKSENKGVMHACGHDMHTSILLGTAKILSNMREHINGNVKFIFQPAEECNPEGGAKFMIEDGVLENPKVDAGAALHVWNFPVGNIGVRYGAMMAQSDRIFIKVKGKSAHGSAPQQGADAIVASAYIITALQSIVSRNVDPLESAVVTIGAINGGYRYNVIADEVNLEGTVRTFNKDIAYIMPQKIRSIVENISEAMGCQCEFDYVEGYALTYNDRELTEQLMVGLKDMLGDEKVIMPEKPATGAEDFSAFTKYIPCTFMWLGCESEVNKGKCIIHNPNFVCDEGAIPVGIKALCGAVLEYLK